MVSSVLSSRQAWDPICQLYGEKGSANFGDKTVQDSLPVGRGPTVPRVAATEKLRSASGFAFRGNRLAREETARGANMLLGIDGCLRAVARRMSEVLGCGGA